ncbi:MAG: hypothetical protein ACK5NY_00535 [Burkholderiaceae bacterium]|jgi:magnesium transporter
MLVNCAVYRNGNKLKDIPTDEISDYVDHQDSFVWVALRDTADNENELLALQPKVGLQILAIDWAGCR